MDKIFRAHKELSEDDYKALWEDALFVFDTNTLLDLYRLPESARKDLLNILSDAKIKDRVWVPFQVMLEYTQNKIDVISDQKNKFTNVKSIVNEGIENINNLQADLQSKLKELQLKKSHSVIDPDAFINDKLFEQSIAALNGFIEHLNGLDQKQPDVNDPDGLKDQVQKVFTGKIGDGFSKDNLEKIYKEGETRYTEKIPPGYKDADKKGFYLFEDRKHIRKFGDLIFWKEIIEKAKADKLKYIILVTGDVKEDWWQEKRGKKLGARYELLNEIYFEAQDLLIFHMYDTSGFMQYAKQYLDINIADASIVETKDVLEVNKLKDENIVQIAGVNLIELIKRMNSAFDINLEIYNDPTEIYYLSIPNVQLTSAFDEIFDNIRNHSTNKKANINIRNTEQHLVIEIGNIRPATESGVEARQHGLKFVEKTFRKYGHIDYMTTASTFALIILIDKEFVKIATKMEFR